MNIGRADTLPQEAYRLTVADDRIEILAGGPEGAFHAVQTLRQLLPAAAFGEDGLRAVELPAVRIDDRPALAYRGLMLDVARHFFTVDEVKRTLDLMALHKMNVFHWHLTDDQGWRIEIRKYPELTRVGSVRKRTLIGKDPGGEYDESCRYDETPTAASIRRRRSARWSITPRGASSRSFPKSSSRAMPWRHWPPIRG